MTNAERVERIKKTFMEGGPMAHNLIGMDLSTLAKSDRELADKTYAELVEQGY